MALLDCELREVIRGQDKDKEMLFMISQRGDVEALGGNVYHTSKGFVLFLIIFIIVHFKTKTCCWQVKMFQQIHE